MCIYIKVFIKEKKKKIRRKGVGKKIFFFFSP